MDEQALLRILSGESRGAIPGLLRGALGALSVPYAAVARRRRRRWAGRAHRAALPVLSVGNLTTGGTGKTPLVAWAVGVLEDLGRSPAIVTRGYRSRNGLSDEARMLARQTGAPVIINPDRAAGAALASAKGADVVVLDDAFQHVRFHRDLDIVAIDATRPFGFDHVLPRGLLREPVETLSFADAIVLTRCDQVAPEALATLRCQVRELSPGCTLAEAVTEPVSLCRRDGRAEAPLTLAGRDVWAFCGLGNPEAFYRTLEALGARLVGRSSFNDHHPYTQADLGFLVEQSADAMLVTTAKDMPRLESLPNADAVAWLEVRAALRVGEEQLREAIASVLKIG